MENVMRSPMFKLDDVVAEITDAVKQRSDRGEVAS
jgi:hypothetical protein